MLMPEHVLPQLRRREERLPGRVRQLVVLRDAFQARVDVVQVLGLLDAQGP